MNSNTLVKSRVPLLDTNAQYQTIASEVKEAALRVLSSGRYVLGPEVEKFEQEFASKCNVAHAVGVNSGTSSLQLSLLASGVTADDEVITVPFTFIATVAAIRYIGAKPVFVDVDPQTLTIDTSQIEDAITDRTRAIMPVHIHGHPANMHDVIDIANRHGLSIVEDAAQAHGSRFFDQSVGSLGHVAGFSFYPGKNLGAFGEAGILVTNDGAIAETARQLRDWGQSKRYHHDRLGFNYRMDSIHGALLSIKLAHLDTWTNDRRRIAQWYRERLSDTGLTLPYEQVGCKHVYHVFCVRHARRSELQRWLREQHVDTGIHYPIPIHLQKCMADLGYRVGDFPVAETAANQVLSLPIFPQLTDVSQAQVIEAVRSFSPS